MKIDVDTLSDELAANPRITDYDYWRSLKILNDEFYQIERNNDPIPFQLIHLRAVLRKARAKLEKGSHAAAGPGAKS